ncbi:hypothetical protein NEOLEDRAFT_1130415 [Neolentinus lepideus HHB14362 ss-1]|uniref:Uncharacterized protein n=1 Tax=Neolentinus lepideus HHB14362 ss-1 TaxID=1314782 RepID=A0A165UBI0_9AGAM|nr:hypothetical protein NEOLEDRAFT_1130415 [Neolentinus lepideus HHB14362 ss-1]
MEPLQTVQNEQGTSKDETAWRTAIEDLDAQMKRYEETRRTGDKEAEQEESRKLVDAMNQIADSHPDPRVQEEWRKKAQAFDTGSDTEKQSLLGDIGKRIAVLFTVPFALVGAVVFATSAAIYGAGNMVGNVLQRTRSRRKSASQQ